MPWPCVAALWHAFQPCMRAMLGPFTKTGRSGGEATSSGRLCCQYRVIKGRLVHVSAGSMRTGAKTVIHWPSGHPSGPFESTSMRAAAPTSCYVPIGCIKADWRLGKVPWEAPGHPCGARSRNPGRMARPTNPPTPQGSCSSCSSCTSRAVLAVNLQMRRSARSMSGA